MLTKVTASKLELRFLEGATSCLPFTTWVIVGRSCRVGGIFVKYIHKKIVLANMGLFTIKNKKQYGRNSGRRKKSYMPKIRTEKKKQKRNTTKQVLVEDEELMSRQQLHKKLKNRNSSINVSGKRKQKMLKRLRHTVRDGGQMDKTEAEMEEEPRKKKTKKTGRSAEKMDVA